jgi:8-hydroxy-5-deazaflavin:NADPH oxidoreductase
MNYAIIGLGKIGTAIAQAFANKGIEVTVAARRPVDALAARIGPQAVARSIEEAVKADVVILAMPFDAREAIARAAKSWQGKIVIDATNAFGVPPEELGWQPSSAVVAQALPGAQVVKAFNHLPAATLAKGPAMPGGGRPARRFGPRRAAWLRAGRTGQDRRGRVADPGSGPHLGATDLSGPGEIQLTT